MRTLELLRDLAVGLGRAPGGEATPAERRTLCAVYSKISSAEQDARRSKSSSSCSIGTPFRTHGAAMRQCSVFPIVMPAARACL